MEDWDEKRVQLKKVVRKFLDIYAISHEEIDDHIYTYVVKDINSSGESNLNLGIFLDNDGKHYQMYAYWGPIGVPDVVADQFFLGMSYLLNGINACGDGTMFYVDRDEEEGEAFIYAMNKYDLFDGLPTEEGLNHRLLDLMGTMTGTAPLIQRMLDGEDPEAILDDLHERLGE